jgi:hypothetical protein
MENYAGLGPPPPDGTPISINDPIHLLNSYNFVGNRLGYLDTCGAAGCDNNFNAVSTSAQPDRVGQSTGTWRFVDPVNGTLLTLQVLVQVSNDWFAGTTDSVSVLFNDLPGSEIVFEGITAGERATIDIDIQRLFGRSSSNPAPIQISDLHKVSLRQIPAPHPLLSDAWKLQSLTIIVNNRAIYRGFENVNAELNVKTASPAVVWSGGINDWSTWETMDSRPIDKDARTYSLRWGPWAGDTWRDFSYDPSTVDGIGIIVGMIDGQLLGGQLKRKTCEILGPGHYIWVYTPNGAILYKQQAAEQPTKQYTRHSQLGSGKPVICAGTFEIEAIQKTPGITTVIGLVNDSSGHYAPDGGACLRNLQDKLRSLGVPTEQITWGWVGG